MRVCFLDRLSHALIGQQHGENNKMLAIYYMKDDRVKYDMIAMGYRKAQEKDMRHTPS